MPAGWQFWQAAEPSLAGRSRTNERTLKIFGGVVLALVLFVGCGALLSDDSSETDVAAPAATSEPTLPTAAPSPAASPTLAPTAPDAVAPATGKLDTAKLKAFLAATYSDTAWIDNITEIRDVGGAAFVETSLPSSSGDGPAICTAVSAFLFSDEYPGDPRTDFPGIRVSSATGERLSFRPTLSAKC